MVGVIIIPGFNFPYNEIEKALEWAKEHEASLKTVFVTTEKMPEESYPFPNDLQEARPESISENPDLTKRQLIDDQLRFLQRRAAASHIPLGGEVLADPSLSTVIKHCENADRVFVDPIEDDPEFLLEGLRFDKDDLLQRLQEAGVWMAER
jgi:hypothetical protein